MATWRAEYFDEPDDLEPVRTNLIEADTEDEAVEKATQQMGGWKRVDVTRTVIKSSN